MRNLIMGLLVLLFFNVSLFAYSGEISAETSPGRITAATETEKPVKSLEKKKVSSSKLNIKPIVLFQPGYRIVGNTSFNQNDQNGFVWGKAKVGMKISDKFKWGIGKFKFEANLASGNFSLKDFYLDFCFNKFLNFRIGQYKVPFLRTNEVSSSKTQFMEKPFLAALSYKRDRGAGIYGYLDTPVAFDYFLSIVNGDGTSQNININDRFLSSFRFGISPLGKFNYTDEVDFKNYKTPKIRVGLGYAYNPLNSRTKELTKEIRYSVDVEGKFRGISLSGAYAVSNRLKQSEKSSFSPYSQIGWYVQIGYLEDFWGMIEPKFRYERYDNNNKSEGFVVKNVNGIPTREWVVYDDAARERYAFGFNIYFKKHNLQLKVDYSMFNFLEGPKTDLNGDPLIGDTFAAQLQFYL